MRLLVAIAAVLTAFAVVESAGAVSRGVVESAYDGDTVRLYSGQRVRLLQIDTPEIGSGECYSRAARKALVKLVPLGSRVTLEADPALDQVDRYGRLLRYVWRNGTNANLALVREGAAAPYFYDGDRGRYASQLLAAARAAKAARRGLWQACPHTVLDPNGPVQTSAAHALPAPRLPALRRASDATRRTRPSAFRHPHRTSTATTCRTGASRSCRPTRTGLMAIATASAARPDLSVRPR